MSEPGRLPVFRFVGHSGSGKTTLLERLIAELRGRGLRVAVAKDTHHPVELDRPGKDTWRLARAGAEQVVLTSPGRLAMFQARDGRPSLAEVARLVAPEVDILLAEGFRDDVEPAIVVWRAALGRDLPGLRGPVVAVVADGPTGYDVPAFGLDDAEGLASFLLSRSPD